jgi:membrane protein
MLRTAGGVVWDAVKGIFEDDVLPLAAGLAYYSLLSMAPLLLVVVSVAGVFFADGQVHAQLIEQMRRLVGEEGAALTQTVIEHTGSEERSAWSLVFGALLTLLGASTVFGQLQYALNRVWQVKAAPRTGLMINFIRQRILSFALVLSVGFLLMVSLVISAVLSTLHTYLDDRLAEAAFFWSGLDLLISFALATALIAMMFKYLPDAEIEWRDTWLGALITAALFIVGKQIIGLYLGQATIASSFGAAASVVIFMIWVYYAGLILLFGAEITQAVAARRGAIVVPTENAKAAPGPPVPGKTLTAVSPSPNDPALER